MLAPQIFTTNQKTKIGRATIRGVESDKVARPNGNWVGQPFIYNSQIEYKKQQIMGMNYPPKETRPTNSSLSRATHNNNNR